MQDTEWKLIWCMLKNSMEGLQYTHKNVVQNLGIDMSTITV